MQYIPSVHAALGDLTHPRQELRGRHGGGDWNGGYGHLALPPTRKYWIVVVVVVVVVVCIVVIVLVFLDFFLV